MLRAIYGVSMFAALSVASWGLKQVGEGVDAVRRRLPSSTAGEPEAKDVQARRAAGKKARKKSPAESINHRPRSLRAESPVSATDT